MILRKLKLTDFLQFRGEQEIDFAIGAAGNVTVVVGAGGRGKTAICRAIRFCLYGAEESRAADREPWVNYTEMVSRAPEKAEARVSLAFEHGGQPYQIERYILGALRDGKVVEAENGVRLVMQDENGKTKTCCDSNEVADLIGS